MNGLLLAIDQLNTWIGKAFAWCIVILTFAMSYEVFSRYLLGKPTEWAFDASYMLYGALFMMAGAYTMARNGHVRGDFIYRSWSPRVQGWVDLFTLLLFFFPGILALVYSGYQFAYLSWITNEHSSFSPNGPPVYHFKAIIPIAGVLMLLQGLAETARCIMCIQSGEWPKRLHDVEELENVILEEVKEKGLANIIHEHEQQAKHP